ncbi:AraC family transcriptional regulator [Bifidobacterium miconisargentati]|uniref:AraC family transcriptional regulator n=1 Tax=Bifidobacterium miconisargentati TaxID=2834437 RepID=UPI001BDC0F7A|nr:AraC family transcriptional regulator [Bifidobacterium miconisargentati]MBW3089830.1 helix-turn-helix transcriptional regulator [Bifidobacterium miconisargentati]
MGTAAQGFEEVLCAATGISLWRYDMGMNLEYTNCGSLCWDSAFRATGCAEQVRLHCSQSDRPMLFETSLSLFWIAFAGDRVGLGNSGTTDIPHTESIENTTEIKGPGSGPAGRCIYTMGPVFISQTSAVDFNRAAQRLDVPDSTLALISEARTSLPTVNAVRFEEYSMLLVFAIRGERISFEDIELKPFDEGRTAKARQEAVGTHQGSYEYERIMLKDIEDGNINYRASRNRMAPMVPTVGKLSAGDPLRQTKNMIIVQIATCSRAAIKGGLPSEISFSMSDSYIQSVEAAHTTVEVQAIGLTMYDDYVRAVWKMKQDNRYSETINRCISMIRMHSTERYTLRQLAAEVGYSPYYLSTRFKKETGTGIGEFMRRAKVEYAQFLLTDTQRGINDIGESLGFSSPSHFIAVFKAETGLTPKQYRESRAAVARVRTS